MPETGDKIMKDPNALFQENDVSTKEPHKPEQQHDVECDAKRCRSDTEK
jgi:hypothetical protein